MLYLILSIIFVSWWALSYKIAFRKNCSTLGVITAAYGTAFILVLLWKLSDDAMDGHSHSSVYSFSLFGMD